MVIDFNQKGVLSDKYMLKKLNLTYIPVTEIYVHKYEIGSDGIMQKNIKAESDLELKTLQWSIKE